MEKIKVFIECSTSELETSVQAWIQEHAAIQIIDRKFTLCGVGDGGELHLYYCYLLVYHDALAENELYSAATSQNSKERLSIVNPIEGEI